MYTYYLYPCIYPFVFTYPYNYLINFESKSKGEESQQFRKSKKEKDKIYIPEVIDLITCFNPAILNTKQFNCIAKLNARKIVKQMLNSILDCDTDKCKQQQQLWYYYNLFYKM